MLSFLLAFLQIMQMGTVASKAPSTVTPTWAFVQANENFSCATGTTCAVTLSASTANSILLVGIIDNTVAGHTIASASGGAGTWNLCPASGCANTTGNWSFDNAYNLTNTGGATSITVTINSSDSSWFLYVNEFKCTANCGTIALDKIATPATSTCTSCTGASFSGLTTGDLLIMNSDTSSTYSAISSPYTLFSSLGYCLSACTGTAPTFTVSPSAVFAAIGISFK